MKLSLESKRNFTLIVIAILMVALTQGVAGVKAIALLLLTTVSFGFVLWLFAFLLMCLISHNVKAVWQEFNPAKMIIECFFTKGD